MPATSSCFCLLLLLCGSSPFPFVSDGGPGLRPILASHAVCIFTSVFPSPSRPLFHSAFPWFHFSVAPSFRVSPSPIWAKPRPIRTSPQPLWASLPTFLLLPSRLVIRRLGSNPSLLVYLCIPRCRCHVGAVGDSRGWLALVLVVLVFWPFSGCLLIFFSCVVYTSVGESFSALRVGL